MKRKYKKILAAAAVILCLAALGLSMMKPADADAEEVGYGNLERKFTVQAELTPAHSMILSTPSAGSVSDIPYKPGEQVKAGEALLKTETAQEISMDLQREQLKQQINKAKQEYDRLYGAGGEAQSAYDAADSAYRLAKKNYEDGRILADSGYLSQTELETARTEMARAYQQYVQAGEVNSEKQRNYLNEQIASSERQLETLEDAVGPTTVVMPFDGILWEVYTEKGAYLAQNQAAVKVYRMDEMKLSASVLAEDAAGLTVGMEAEAVYPDGIKGRVTVAFIARTASKAISSTGLEESRCQVELDPQDPDTMTLMERFGAGQQADLTFHIIKAENVLTVPVSAVVPDGTDTVVYRVRAGKAEAAAVKAGTTENGRTEILEGLTEGDVVISDPYDSGIVDGSRVKTVF